MDAIKVSASVRDGNGKALRAACARGSYPRRGLWQGLADPTNRGSPEAIKGRAGQRLGPQHGREPRRRGQQALTVLLSDFQYHPMSRALLTRLLQIHMDQPVNVEVPLELTGKAAG